MRGVTGILKRPTDQPPAAHPRPSQGKPGAEQSPARSQAPRTKEKQRTPAPSPLEAATAGSAELVARDGVDPLIAEAITKAVRDQTLRLALVVETHRARLDKAVRAKQEAILSAVSGAVNENLEGAIRVGIEKEMEAVRGQLPKMMEESMRESLAPVVLRLMPAAVAQAMEGQPAQRVVAEAIQASITPRDVQTSFKKSFERTMLPPLERSTQKVFADVVSTTTSSISATLDEWTANQKQELQNSLARAREATTTRDAPTVTGLLSQDFFGEAAELARSSGHGMDEVVKALLEIEEELDAVLESIAGSGLTGVLRELSLDFNDRPQSRCRLIQEILLVLDERGTAVEDKKVLQDLLSALKSSTGMDMREKKPYIYLLNSGILRLS